MAVDTRVSLALGVLPAKQLRQTVCNVSACRKKPVKSHLDNKVRLRYFSGSLGAVGK